MRAVRAGVRWCSSGGSGGGSVGGGRAAPPLHESAALGFAAGAVAQYEAGRPEWERAQLDAAVKYIDCRSPPGADGRFPAMPVVEVGCGSGKSTRPLHALLQEHCAPGALPNLVCVEPGGMAAGLVDALPGVRVYNAMAEAMPLPDGGASAVCCFQSFHWFASRDAVREIHRVLAPGAFLVLAWNTRDAGAGPAMAALEHIVDEAYAADPTPTPRQHTGAWRSAVDGAPGFSPLRHVCLPRAGGGATGSEDAVVSWILSVSVIAKLAPARRADVEARVRAVLRRADFPRAAAGGPRGAGAATLHIPMRSDFYFTQKQA